MDIVERLHPCPFCGAEPVVKDLAGWEVYCTNCGASGPTVFPGTANETTLRADAVSTWNASNREIERLRDENEALASNLRGKHATTGATYAHLIAERDSLRAENAKLRAALKESQFLLVSDDRASGYHERYFKQVGMNDELIAAMREGE